MARQAISKDTRFDVFHRDGFQCQYCGAKPPHVVLEVDHLVAVANGGDNDPLNLVTSCEPCNRGKRAKVLGNVAPRPDADQMFMVVQQEIAELKRYIRTRKKLQRMRLSLATSFAQTVLDEADFFLCESYFYNLICQYGPDAVESAIQAVIPKIVGRYVTGKGSITRYLAATARNIFTEANNG